MGLTAADLLLSLREAGLQVRLAETETGLEIRVKGQPTPEQADAIRSNREALLAYLLAEARQGEDVDMDRCLGWGRDYEESKP